MSSNSKRPIDVSESDSPTPLARPMGQNEVKRKVKVKGASSSTPFVDLSVIAKEMKEINVVQKQIIEAMESDRCTIFLWRTHLKRLKINTRNTKSLVIIFL